MSSRLTKSARVSGIVSLLALTLGACGPAEEEPRVSYAEAEAIAEVLVAGLRSGMDSFREPSSTTAALTKARDKALDCAPDELIPPMPCDDGGDVRTTVNLRCDEPSGCCGDDPPCTRDELALDGQIGVLFNRCRFRAGEARVEIQGTITGTLTLDSVLECGGGSSTKLLFTQKGMPSITIDGREACPGILSLTTQAFVDSEIVLLTNGSVCGVQVALVHEEGCVLTCADGHCCPGASVCGTLSEEACFAGGYTVDCGGGVACPTGTRCVNGGTQCAY